jgi:pimeloyl-ACP methyl ester carboxylesterase
MDAHNHKKGASHFAHFLANYSSHYFIRNSQHWQYRWFGQGAETVLLLPGAPGLSSTSFQDILFFESEFRILVPDYPAYATTFSEIVDGLAELLTGLNIERVHLVGGSYGGLLAQDFARRYPERVSKLVLSHSSLPRKSRARLLSWITALVKIFPEPLIQAITQAGLPIFMRSFPDQDGLWYACFAHVLATLRKADYLARLHVHIDFDRCEAFSNNGPHAWKGQTLLIEADNDPYTTESERTALQHLYPHASIHTFHQTAHYAWASDPQPYFTLIKTFLRS